MLILLYESRARLVHVHGNFLVYIFLILNKYALTMNPLARSLEEFLPHRISSTTWCFMLLRTILVMATHLTGFLIPYYGLVMALIGSLLSTLVNGGEPEEKKVCGRPRKAASQCNTMRAKRAVVAMLARSKESVKIEDINMTEEERTEEERTEKEQKELMPLLMGGKLKSYQLKGVKWLISLQNNMY
ncbi:ATP-dependent DNA helicase [Arachis hypogaea]|nr:ATP-dependent DNA helicase [Arachis hypogaea]